MFLYNKLYKVDEIIFVEHHAEFTNSAESWFHKKIRLMQSFLVINLSVC